MSAGIAFELAGPGEESDIRRLLREVPLGGKWSLALARDPDAFGGPHLPGERQDFIIARDTANGSAVGLCERVVRCGYLGGEPVDLPYLGALRVVPSHRHRLSILKGGFAALRAQCERESDFPEGFTSITSDNSPARRVLTAGLRGLPRYRPLTDFSTFAIRPRRAPADAQIGEVAKGDREELDAFLASELARRDCAPAWSTEAHAALGPIRFLVLRRASRIAGCIAVWDQRATRQAILADCPRAVRVFRSPANLAARIAGFPAIPAVGEPIGQVFLSFLATRDDDPAAAVRLVSAGLGLAKAAGADAAMIGVPTAHQWRDVLRRRFRAIEYRTSLYAVAWPERRQQSREIDAARMFPEVGLL